MRTAAFVVLSLALAPALSWADTVSITAVTDLSSPAGQVVSSTAAVGFGGPNMITFNVAGKTCNWLGSANPSASGSNGCNYQITVNNSTGQLSNPGNAVSNSGCTQPAQMLALCK